MSGLIEVNEVFGPTIQGEGRTAGKKVHFVRLARCNLACVWCDTPYTWNWHGTPFEHPEKYNPDTEIYEKSPEWIHNKLKSLDETVKRVVVSGGEPLLQQDALLPLFKRLKEDEYKIEVETNGTKTPNIKIFKLVDIFNCSPKLSNSGPDNKESMRIRERTLKTMAGVYQDKVIFKFVVSRDEDVDEILEIVKRFNMDNVYLMPLGVTRDEQMEWQQRVMMLCEKYDFEFSPRVQVLMYDDQRGV